jgi:hypothetical protein
MTKIPFTNMPLHELMRKSRLLFKKRRVRIMIGLVIVALLAGTQYYLANVPLPVDLETIKIPTVRAGQEFVLDRPVIGIPPANVFGHQGNENEIIEAQFTNARVADETIATEHYDPSAATPGPVSYGNLRSEQNDSPPCTTALEMKLSPTQTRACQIRLFQSKGPGNENYRDLEAQSNTETLLTLQTIPGNPPTGKETISPDNGPGCEKRIKVGSRIEEKEGVQVLKLHIAPDSKLSFRFLPRRKEVPIWEGVDGLLEPFRVASPIYSSQRVAIGQPGGKIIFEATSAKDSEPLNVNRLKLGSDQLILELSGMGFVTLNGETVTVNLFERIQRYPIWATLFATASVALVTWLIQQTKELFK